MPKGPSAQMPQLPSGTLRKYLGTPRNPAEPVLTKKSQMFCKNAKIAYLFVRKCPIWKKGGINRHHHHFSLLWLIVSLQDLEVGIKPYADLKRGFAWFFLQKIQFVEMFDASMILIKASNQSSIFAFERHSTL